MNNEPGSNEPDAAPVGAGADNEVNVVPPFAEGDAGAGDTGRIPRKVPRSDEDRFPSVLSVTVPPPCRLRAVRLAAGPRRPSDISHYRGDRSHAHPRP
mgnify:CR=1 FL=1